MAEDINIKVQADTAQATSAFDKLASTMSSLSTKVQKSAKDMYNAGHTIQEVGQNIYSIGQRATIGISAPLAAMSKSIIQGGANVLAFESAYTQSMKEMASAGDKFAEQTAKAIGATTNQVREQLLAFNKYAKGMGMTGDEALAFAEKMSVLTADLSAFSDVPLDEATDRMKSALMGNYEAVDQLGLSFGEATIKQEMLREGLSGQFSELKETTKMQLLYNLAMQQSKDAVGQASRESESYQAKMNKLKGTLENLYKNVFVVLEPQVIKLADSLTQLVEKLQQMSPEQIEFWANLVKWAIIIPPVILYFGALVENIGRLWKVLAFGKSAMAVFLDFETIALKLMYFWDGVVAVWGTVTGAFASMGTAIMSGLSAVAGAVGLSVGWMIAIIAGIAVAVYLVIKYWDEIKAFTIQAWGAISEYLAGVWVGITAIFNNALTTIQPILQAVATAFTDIFTKYVLPAYQTYVAPIVQFFVLIGQLIWQVVSVVASSVGILLMAIGAVVVGLGNVIWTVIMFVVDVFKVLWQVIVFVSNVIGIVLATLGGIFAVIFGAISTVVLVLGKIIEWLVMGIIVPLFEMIGAVLLVLAGMFIQHIMGTVKNVIDGLMTVLKALANVFMWLFNNAINPVLQWIVSGFKWLNSAIAPIISGIASAWTSFGSSITAGYTNYIKPAFDWIVAGLRTLNSQWSNIWHEIGSVFNNVISGIAGAWSRVINAFKLPHLSVSGDFSILPPKVPSFDIKWYANGGIVDQPTMGVFGEAGTEANIPLGNLNKMRPFAQAVANLMPDRPADNEGSGGGDVVIQVASLVVREEADIDKVAEKLHKLQERNRRGKGGNKNGI